MTDTAERLNSAVSLSASAFSPFEPARSGRRRAAGWAIALSASAVLWVGIIGAFIEIAHIAL